MGIFDLALRVLERRADVAVEHRYFGAPLLLAAEQGGDPAPRSGDGLEMWENWWNMLGNGRKSRKIGEDLMFRFAFLQFPKDMGRNL